METLTIPEAFKVYLLMKPYLPEKVYEITAIDFIRQLVDNIIGAGKPKIYLDIVSMLTGIEIENLIQNTPEDVLDAFTDELLKQHISELIDFCRKIGL